MIDWRENAKTYIVDRHSLRVKACPFCGSVRTALLKTQFTTYNVLCFNCGAHVFFCEKDHYPEKIIEQYNTRSQKAKTHMTSVYGKAALEAGKNEKI